MMNFSLRSLVTSAWLWQCLAFLITLPLLLFLVLNVVFQFLQKTIQNLFQDGKLTTGSPLQYDPSWWTTLAWSTSLAFALCGVCFLLERVLLLKYWLKFRDLKAAQKGRARFTTFQELKQQYRDVPNRKETYNGSGGVPIGRYRDRLYIDDSAVNNLVIGTTRSGKGEKNLLPKTTVSESLKRTLFASSGSDSKFTASVSDIEVFSNRDNPEHCLVHFKRTLMIDANGYEETSNELVELTFTHQNGRYIVDQMKSLQTSGGI
ncbi:MAG: hypothetical protein ACRC00_11930 [Exiguobacterium acetylicum]